MPSFFNKPYARFARRTNERDPFWLEGPGRGERVDWPAALGLAFCAGGIVVILLA